MPSWPLPFSPQHTTVPELRSAHVWYWPLATWRISSQSPLPHSPPTPQTRPHAPQFVGSFETSVSQPRLPGEQSAKPPSHTTTLHVPARQVPVVTFGRLLQTLPQKPQFAESVVVAVSQPSAALPLQSAKPGLQLAIVHAPPVHAGVPFGIMQTWQLAPQAVTDVGEASQPLDATRSQSWKPPVHAVIEQPPDAQAQVALPPEHARPQLPQFVTLLDVLVSQLPFMSQSAVGAVHIVVEVRHVRIDTSQNCIAVQALPQLEQSVEVPSGVSQPVAIIPSQSDQPASQSVAGSNEQLPDTQA